MERNAVNARGALVRIFFSKYRMTVSAWLRLFVLSIAVNVLAVVGPVAFLLSAIPGGGIMAMLFGVPLGLAIAFVPALSTILIASVYAHFRGYFSFLQFVVIGTLVSCAIAARAIAGGNDHLIDHVHTVIWILPFAWIFGWAAASFLGVLPSPLTAESSRPRLRMVMLKGAVATTLVAVPVTALSEFATVAMESREQRRAVEQRGNCPDGLQCAVYTVNKRLDPTLYVVKLAGQQFVLAGSSIGQQIRNGERIAGEVDAIPLIGLLPDFSPRSTSNFRAFDFPSEDVARVMVTPICYPSGFCNPLPNAFSKGTARQPKKGEPVYIASDQHFVAPAGMVYLGDIDFIDAWKTTIENASRHVYANAARDEFIICSRLADVPNPSCIHTFAWERFRVEVRFQPHWMANWSETKAHIIAQLDGASSVQTLPAGAIHIVDPLS